MKKISINKNVIITGAIMLALGLLIGWLVKPSGHDGHQEEASASSTSAATIWTCSMDPQVRQPEPGKCPICGMDLIPLESGMDDDNPVEIRMSPTALKLANVQTAVIDYGAPVKEVRMTGKIQPDERLIYSQVTHLEGRVEQLAVNYTGEPIRRGQRLASIYSPDLVTAQQEVFAAMKLKDTQPALFNAAKDKLKNWKLTEAQIESIISSGKPQERFPILADVSGIVRMKMVNLGDYIMRGMPIYEVMDLSKVWVLFDVYESDMTWVKVGSRVDFTIQSLPGDQFTGRVTFIDPVIDPMTRVATARVEMSNPGGKLKPEMFATGIVKTELSSQKRSLMVPKSAVMWTGERSVVYIKNETEQGVSFYMQEVTLGPSLGDSYMVVKGLEPGTEIAVNGTFSIDAAAQLAGKPSMMSPQGGAAMAGHNHGEMAAPQTEPVKLDDKAKTALQKVFDSYFPLKDALVKTDYATSKSKAQALKNAITGTDMKLFTGAAHDLWMQHSSIALASLDKMLSAKDVEEVRKNFKPLSTQMVMLARTFGPFKQTVFLQHCPMADGNKGGDWLSLEKQIQNPYFGDKMMKCGKVTQTFAAN